MGDELINPLTGLPLGATLTLGEKAWNTVNTAPGLTTATGNTPWGSTWGRVPTTLGNPSGTYSTTLPHTSATSNVNLSNINNPNNYLGLQYGPSAAQIHKEWLEGPGLWGISNGSWGQIGTVGQLGLGAFNLWNAYQANKINKANLAFQKDAWNKQYQNSLGSYLNNYTDVLGSRAAMLGYSGDAADSYVTNNLARIEDTLKSGTNSSAASEARIRQDLDKDLGA